jgi:hypothetical protein
MNAERRVPCQEIEDQLSAYVDGELSPQEIRVVEVHLADCPRCASILEELRAMVRSAGSLPSLKAPDGLRDRILEQVRAEGAPVAPRVRPFWFRIGAVSAAAGLLLVASLYVGGVFGGRQARRGEETARLYRRAPEAQTTGAPEPSEQPEPSAPAAPTEDAFESKGYAVGRAGLHAGEQDAPPLQARPAPTPAGAGTTQIAFLVYAPDQKDDIDSLVGKYVVEARDKKKEDLDQEPPPLDKPEAHVWNSMAMGANRRLTPEEVDRVNQARIEQNRQDLSLTQERADQILESISRAGAEVLLWPPLPEDEEKEELLEAGKEPEADGRAKRLRESEEFFRRVNDRTRKLVEEIRKARGEMPDSGETRQYRLLRIFIRRE